MPTISAAVSKFADMMLSRVVPSQNVMAACTGSYLICIGSNCAYGSRTQYRCVRKANCTDSCAPTGQCCLA